MVLKLACQRGQSYAGGFLSGLLITSLWARDPSLFRHSRCRNPLGTVERTQNMDRLSEAPGRDGGHNQVRDQWRGRRETRGTRPSPAAVTPFTDKRGHPWFGWCRWFFAAGGTFMPGESWHLTPLPCLWENLRRYIVSRLLRSEAKLLRP